MKRMSTTTPARRGGKKKTKPRQKASPSALARQRRAELRQAAGDAGAGIDVEPEVITACAVEISGDAEALGAPELSPEAEAALGAETDEQVVKVGGVIAGVLPDAPAVSTATGVTPKAIEDLIGQRTEMYRADRTAAKLG